MKLLVPLALVALLWGCDAAPAPDAVASTPEDAVEEMPQAQTDPELLPTPFTADEIRDEWVEGLTLVMQTQTAESETWERWTVVAADADGADIEFAPVDVEGNALGEAKIERSAWVELRDHAKYPADVATREQAMRDTALGQLEGWLYRVRDAATDSETEVFFATRYPGAPIEMKMSKDDVVAMELKQVERSKPDG